MNPNGTKRAERLIFEYSSPGRRGVALPKLTFAIPDLPAPALRKSPPALPHVTEVDVVRHYTRLSQMNFCVDTNFYPLGSCTMKYNPRANERLAGLEGFAAAHPYQDDGDVQGLLELQWDLERYLAEIAGLDAVTLAPAAGAHGELTGMMIIAAYHRDRGEGRSVVLIPDSAHGTNPASAALCGYRAEEIASNGEGRIDINALARRIGGDTAALMITNPNTLGIFETYIRDVAEVVHSAGATLYMDGANMNAIMGIAKPGEFGVDVMHFNLHKTFSTPHGCGGPGAGPVAVTARLAPYLPVPFVEKADGRYAMSCDRPKSIGRMRSFAGNIGVLVRAYLYIRSMGPDGLRRAADMAVFHSDYLRSRLAGILPLAYPTNTRHEFVLTAQRLAKKGVRALDIAKRLLDYGIHPPTVYFPLIVREALMIEPTETENLKTLDAFVDAMREIVREAGETPEVVTSAPHTMPIGRLDEVKAVKEPRLTWQPH